jgi:hypothetical protein
MKRFFFVVCSLLSVAASVAVANDGAPTDTMTAAQIVDKNVAARGGLDAWRKIQSMAWAGHIEAPSAPAPRIPFFLEQKRPNKTRFEVKAQNQISLRTFDGTTGWKVRPSASGKPEVQPFTSEELSFARDGQGIDGLLIDHAKKGLAVGLDGIDEVEGRKAYRLTVTLPSGVGHHVWVDAETFLDIKYERPTRNSRGQAGTTSVFYRDYRTVEGLQIPLTIETGSDSGKAPDKMVIERIALNPRLDDRMFARPQLPGQRQGVTVDTRSPPRLAGPVPGQR